MTQFYTNNSNNRTNTHTTPPRAILARRILETERRASAIARAAAIEVLG